MNEINVEKIMEEIRAEIPEQEEGWAALRFEDIPVENGGEESGGGAFDRRDFDKDVAGLSGSWELDFLRPLPGGVKGLFKRVLRKLMRFCVEPVCQDAAAFHRFVMRAMQNLRRFVGETLEQNRRRDREIDELRAQVEELRSRIDELERRA